jgi:hypothetical protein
MNEEKIQGLITECKQLQEDSTYNAEVHYIMADKLSRKAFWCKFIPVAISIFSAYQLATGAPNWIAWIALIASLFSLLSIILEPEKISREHLSAAKNFTALKHDARSLYESFRAFISEQDFYHNVKQLREKYNLIIQFAPSTGDKAAWKLATERIKKGIHIADFRYKDKDSA